MASFAETVSGYDSHTEASENSSVGTDVEEGIDPRDELHLTDSFCCHCIFFRKVSSSTTRVCGNNRTTCSRKSHSKEGSARGLAGFYRALIGIRENSNQDGDNSTFRSTEDVLEDQNRRRRTKGFLQTGTRSSWVPCAAQARGDS